jgi:glycosyltransferase involved in cell wall biosynthesis
MRIGIDLRWLQLAYLRSPDEGALGGMGVVIENLWRGLAEVAPPDITPIGLLTHGPVPAQVSALLEAMPRGEAHRIGLLGLCSVLDRRRKYQNVINLIEAQWALRPMLRRLRLDVLHMTDQHAPPPRSTGYPTIVTLHALFADSRPGWLVHRILLDRIGDATCVAAVSDAVRTDYVRHHNQTGANVRTIHNGIDLAIFRPAPDTDVTVREGLPAEYLLHVGALLAHKNPRGIFSALARLRRERSIPPLVSVGPYQAVPGVCEHVLGMAREAGVADKLIVLDRGLPPRSMAALYRGARGLVFPSLTEGFGLPAIESLACGTPCVVAGTGGLVEVAGDLGLFVDGTDPASIADGIVRLLDDESHRRRVRAEGPEWAKRFSYQEMARRYLAIYTELAR